MTPQKSNNKILARTLAYLSTTAVLFLPVAPCFALSTDREQPIHIQSNYAEQNEKQGLTTYQGKVQMTQGSIRILANKVMIYSTDGEVNKIIATGSPAHYEQQPSPDKGTVIGKGDTIEYLLDEEKLHLIDNASLDQQGTTMTGKNINYDMKASQVKATGGATSNEQIQMVIPPKAKADTSEPAAAAAVN